MAAASPDPEPRQIRRHRRLAALGTVLVVIAAAAFGYEMLAAVGGGGWRIVPTGELWFAIDTGSLNLAQAVVQRYVHPGLWDPVIAGLLQWPLWSILGGPGAALMMIYGQARHT